MAGFQYFIKCEREKTLEVAVAESSLDMFSDRIGMHKYCNLNGGGFMFDVRGKDNGVTVGLRDGQEHIEFDDFTLIYDKDDKPAPEDFLIQNAIDGDLLLLGDGNLWMIPLARKIEEGNTHLPSNIIQIKKGKFIKVPFEEYTKMIDLANVIWDDVVSGYDDDKDREFKIVNSDDKILEAFQSIIKFNYDLEWFEISALKLMTSDNVTSVLYALVDYKTLDAYLDDEKKK